MKTRELQFSERSLADKRVHPRGFALIELLVCIAIIAILASLLLPALTRAKQQSLTVLCFNNQKQLSYAWIMYSMANDDKVPPNFGYLGPSFPPAQTWVYGWLDNDYQPDWTDNTNILFLKESLLGPFLSGSIGVWKCPADPSSSLFDGRRLPRVRSYSMNIFLNSEDFGPNDPWRMVRKIGHIQNPSPSDTFVTIDDREDSIIDGVFVVDMYNSPPILADVPRSAHNTGGTLGFADGHSERRRWVDPRTMQPPVRKHGNLVITGPTPSDPDLIWLQSKTTGPK